MSQTARSRGESQRPSVNFSRNTHRYSRGDWVKLNKSNTSSPRRTKQLADFIKSTLLDNDGALKLGRKHRPDYRLPVIMLVLSLVGLVVLFSIIPAISGGDDKVANVYMIKQVLFLAAGIAAFFAAGQIPLDWWRKHGNKVFLFGLIICLALPILGALKIPIASCKLGACRWYAISGLSFQPAEILKLGLLFVMASMLACQASKNRLSSLETLLKFFTIMLIVMVVIAGLQKDLGTALALMAIMLTQLIISGISWRYIGYILGSAVAMGVVSIIVAPHRLERVATFFGNGNAATDYHINQAMIAIGSGGLMGRGLGKSVQAFGWLPEAVNDSIFAIIAEMLGFIGVVALLGAFVYLLKIILEKIDYTENYYLRLVVAGVFGWLGSHVVLNIGAMTHIIPLTGITLPFVSFGGTSMICSMFGLGIVFAISRYVSHRRFNSVKEKKGEDSLRRRGQRWSHYANSSRY